MNDIRYYIDLCEGVIKRRYVGNCVDSFDLDGDCIIGELPFNSVSDLGLADEESVDISRELFLSKVNIPDDLVKNLSDNIYYMYYDNFDLYMIYDAGTDIHYFFA